MIKNNLNKKNMKTFSKIFIIAFTVCLCAACETSPELTDFAGNYQLPSEIVSGTLSNNYGLVVIIDNNKVESDGGSQIQDKGIVFSESSAFDLSDENVKIVSNGSGVGTYSSTLTGLEPLTTYYFRAFAINSKGIVYGEEKSFKTLSLDDVPSVEAEFSSEFLEADWPVEVIVVPGIYYKALSLYDDGYDISIDVSPDGKATVARQPITGNLFGYGTGYIAGTGQLEDKTIELALTFTVSAGSFGTFLEKITLP
jgi:hypothetical protein